MPDRLFHYQKFVCKHFISLLSERKVRLSNPNNFNDPWDCRVHYRAPRDSEEGRRLLEWLAKMVERFVQISEAEFVPRAQDFMSNPSSFVQMQEGMYRELCKVFRVYCLSEIPDSPLMWAHYADSHKGVCLEFDALTAPFSRGSGATKVKYQDTYPAYDIDTAGYKFLVTKSEDWSYEAEWRLIAEERAFAQAPTPRDVLTTDDDYLTLPAGVLKSVTIGCLADESSRHLIEHLVKSYAPGVLVRQAVLASDRYELIITPPFSAKDQ